MVQLSRSGIVFRGSTEDQEQLQAQFEAQHCITLPGFLDTPLLHLIQRHIDQAEFHERHHRGIGTEVCMAANHTAGLLHFLTNHRQLLRFVERVTGCGRIGCFAGRVYRMVHSSGHYDSWHDDVGECRLIGMSINLSSAVYGGGVFQLRDRRSKQILHQVANTGFGDAILFRIASHLQHRVDELEGTIPRTAFAGWFQSHPEYQILKRS